MAWPASPGPPGPGPHRTRTAPYHGACCCCCCCCLRARQQQPASACPPAEMKDRRASSRTRLRARATARSHRPDTARRSRCGQPSPARAKIAGRVGCAAGGGLSRRRARPARARRAAGRISRPGARPCRGCAGASAGARAAPGRIRHVSISVTVLCSPTRVSRLVQPRAPDATPTLPYPTLHYLPLPHLARPHRQTCTHARTHARSLTLALAPTCRGSSDGSTSLVVWDGAG